MVEKSNKFGRRGLLSLLKPARKRGIEIKLKRARVIGVFSCKGGVGKTTTLANVGLYISQVLHGNVLAIDANLSAPNLGLHFGELDPKVTIHDAISNEVPVEEAVTHFRTLDTLLGSIAYGEEIHLVDLKSIVDPLRHKYKLILVDSAPGIGSEVVAAMKTCDEIIIVTNPEIPTVASTLKTFRAAEQYKVPILGVVVNKVRGEAFELPLKDVKKALGWPIIASVPEDIKVRESTAAGVPVVAYDMKSKAAREFKKLSEFLVKHITKK
jgi:MinD-like ATPase involved in chromosome partitioning or flagellar assembly